MPKFGIKAAILLMAVAGAFAATTPGCERNKNGIDWDASLSGRDGDIGRVGLSARFAPPAATPIPQVAEQLEKGNAAKVAVQVRPTPQLKYQDILPNPDIALPAVPTPARPEPESRSSSSTGSGAWYNGFLP